MLDDSWIEKLYASSGHKKAGSATEDNGSHPVDVPVYGDDSDGSDKRSVDQRVEF